MILFVFSVVINVLSTSQLRDLHRVLGGYSRNKYLQTPYAAEPLNLSDSNRQLVLTIILVIMKMIYNDWEVNLSVGVILKTVKGVKTASVHIVNRHISKILSDL